MKVRILLLFISIFCLTGNIFANRRIYVNREVTTHIVMPENIKMVDISTPKIAGNQCTDNIVRIKPYHENDSLPDLGYDDNELLGTLTLIGERHIAQYDVLYTQSPGMASNIIMCHTTTCSRTSTRRFPCRWRRWHAMRGRSMAATASSTRLYRTSTA